MSKLPEGFNPEQKEEEKKSPIFIIYRDNDLFQKQIPEMVKILSAMGRQVEVQSFPKKTNEKEIKEWYKENKELLAGKEIISDWTASIPYEMREDLSSKGMKEVGNLDTFFTQATDRIIFSEGHPYEDDKRKDQMPIVPSEEQTKKWFSAVIEHVLSNPENIPNKVLIFLDRIVDHTNIIGYEEQEKLKGQKLKEAEKMVAGKLKEWFVNGGMDADKITIGPRFDDLKKDEAENIIREIDKPNNWVITDRHYYSMKDKGVKSAKCLELPEGNFYQELEAQGLIKIKDEELVEALGKVLEENFSDKKEPA